MMLALLIVLLVLSFACSIWALVIIFKRSIVGGLLSLFLGLPMLYFLVTGWGKEGQDIRKPFFLSLILYGIAIAIGVSMGLGAAMEVQDQLQQQTSTPPARPATKVRETPPPAESVRRDPPAPQPAATPQPVAIPQPAAAAPPAAAPQPVAAPRAPVQRTEAPRPAQQPPSSPMPAQRNCVYKPVMTDEDIANCR